MDTAIAISIVGFRWRQRREPGASVTSHYEKIITTRLKGLFGILRINISGVAKINNGNKISGLFSGVWVLLPVLKELVETPIIYTLEQEVFV